MVPVTLDFLKREYFVRQVAAKERAQLQESRTVVQKIMEEKKRHVTFEQVLRYVFKLNLDKPMGL